MLRKILVITAICGFAGPLSAADLLCSDFKVSSEFYYSKAALDDFKPDGWEAKPFMIKNFPTDPVFYTGGKKFPLKKVASSSTPFQGDLYIIPLGDMYMMWEFQKDLDGDKDQIFYYVNPTMTYESECEVLVD